MWWQETVRTLFLLKVTPCNMFDGKISIIEMDRNIDISRFCNSKLLISSNLSRCQVTTRILFSLKVALLKMVDWKWLKQFKKNQILINTIIFALRTTQFNLALSASKMFKQQVPS